jgi:hypothetical protein
MHTIRAFSVIFGMMTCISMAHSEAVLCKPHTPGQWPGATHKVWGHLRGPHDYTSCSTPKTGKRIGNVYCETSRDGDPTPYACGPGGFINCRSATGINVGGIDGPPGTVVPVGNNAEKVCFHIYNNLLNGVVRHWAFYIVEEPFDKQPRRAKLHKHKPK